MGEEHGSAAFTASRTSRDAESGHPRRDEMGCRRSGRVAIAWVAAQWRKGAEQRPDKGDGGTTLHPGIVMALRTALCKRALSEKSIPSAIAQGDGILTAPAMPLKGLHVACLMLTLGYLEAKNETLPLCNAVREKVLVPATIVSWPGGGALE